MLYSQKIWPWRNSGSCALGTESVDIVFEGSVLGHGAECDQGVAESVLFKVVWWPVVFLGFEALSDGVGEVRVVLLGAAHVACSG